jgi:XapX domain-containing protein
MPTFSQGTTMKAYLVSLVVGTIVGVIYGVLRVKSPAPPTVALVGLFGMLAGEQLITLIRSLLR